MDQLCSGHWSGSVAPEHYKNLSKVHLANKNHLSSLNVDFLTQKKETSRHRVSAFVLKLHAECLATECFIIDACLAHEVSNVVLNSLLVTDADFSERCSTLTMALRL
jgi:hypothetical protein